MGMRKYDHRQDTASGGPDPLSRLVFNETGEGMVAMLRKSLTWKDSILNNSSIGILVVTGDRIITEVNPCLCRMFGYAADEMLGKPVLLIHRSREAYEEFGRLFYQKTSGGVVVTEYRLRRKDGSAFWCECSGSAMDPKDLGKGVIWMVQDISERKAMEEDLVRAKERAEAASRAKSQFLANMSHEIRTPMNAVLGFAQIMGSDAELTAAQRKYLDAICTNGEHLLALINDILEMSKIEAGRVSLMNADFDLHALVGDLDTMFRPRIEAKHLAFRLEGLEKVPRCLNGDEGKIRQVLVNMLGNAVKFTEKGSIVIRLDAAEKERHGTRDWVIGIEVEDTGQGIPADEIGKVFEIFEQAENVKAVNKGAGLGMAISRRYARMMGGDITVRSEEGRGATFRFVFGAKPLSSAGSRAPRSCDRRVIGLAGTGRPAPKVLVADDTGTNREVLREMLEMVGFVVTEAVNGREALEAFRQQRPDLVLMDRRMPEMDGIEATRALKSSEEGRATPVIMVTASVFEDRRQEAIDAGADGYIRKPYRMQELLHEIGKLLAIEYRYEGDPQ
ncbi:MAG: response regulator [Nitrospirota bacterium]